VEQNIFFFSKTDITTNPIHPSGITLPTHSTCGTLSNNTKIDRNRQSLEHHQPFSSFRTFDMTITKDLSKKGRKGAKTAAGLPTANSANSANRMETSPTTSAPIHSVEATHPAHSAHGEGDNLLQATAAAQQEHTAEEMDVDDESIPGGGNINDVSSFFSDLSVDLPSAENLLAEIKEQMETNRIKMATIDQHIAAKALQNARLKNSGVNDPNVALYLTQLKERRDELAMVADDLATSFKNLAASSSPLPPAANNNPADTDSDDESVNTTSTSQLYYKKNKKLPVKLQSHWPTYKGAGGMHAYSFIDIFTTRLRLELGDDIFFEHGPTYLCLLTTNVALQDRLITAFNKLGEETVSLDLMEQTFIDVCMTQHERERSVEELMKIGRIPGESFEKFAQRVRRLSKSHRIERNSSVVLACLKKCVTGDQMNMVNNFYLHAVKNARTHIPETIDDFCTALEKLNGPDDARDSFDYSQYLEEEERRKNKSRDQRDNRDNRDRRDHRNRRDNHAKQYCDKCHKNTNHHTDDHVECDYCKKTGHEEKDCHTKQREQRGNNRFSNRNSRDRNSRDNNRHQPYGDSYRPNGSSGRDNRDSRDNRNNQRDSDRNYGKQNTYRSNSYVHDDDYYIELNEMYSLPSSEQTRADEPPTDLEFMQLVHLVDSVRITEGRETNKDTEKLTINDEALNAFETVVYNELSLHDGVRITLPLYFDDVRYEALLDTGATRSFIDLSVVKQANLPIRKANGNIFLGHKKMHVARTGYTDDITIECNNHTIMANFEVFELKHPFVIGLDLMNRIGLSIAGIDDGRDSAQRLPPPKDDEIPSILPLTTPKEELTKEFAKEKSNFLLTIADALQANSEIPQSSHCPLPEMKVSLEVPSRTVLFRRPRVFAQQQQHIFDEQVDKWIKDGVITKAPPGNPHNNTLTLAAKKDLFGNKTKWRVCLDPRPLNKLLPDENHPVHLISDNLQQKVGHEI
jgi:hypothetical protein